MVADRYGLLSHYTIWQGLTLALDTGSVGGPQGCWLTPTPYAGCVAPYDLGLNTPRDVCLLVDVSELVQLWGPGMAAPSGLHPSIWRGGALEFYSPFPIEFTRVRRVVIGVDTCGDTHR
jgi:hypothetical protein